jgi:DNA-binding XRE family transcriptional regulator/mannose-6-phosphate isomerase-like protein (cupin superfamily)
MSDATQTPAGAQQRETLTPELGARLRAARTAKGLALRELSRRIGVSASMVSQIERGSVMPSVATLYKLVSELGLSLDELFAAGHTGPPNGDPGDTPSATPGAPAAAQAGGRHSPVQRKDTRPTVTLASGVRWERMASFDDHGVEFIHSEYPVGGESCPADALVRHGGREFGYVEDGRLGVTIGFDTYELDAGDSIAFDSGIPHRLFAIGDEPAHVVWFVIDRSGDVRSGS